MVFQYNFLYYSLLPVSFPILFSGRHSYSENILHNDMTKKPSKLLKKQVFFSIFLRLYQTVAYIGICCYIIAKEPSCLRPAC